MTTGARWLAQPITFLCCSLLQLQNLVLQARFSSGDFSNDIVSLAEESVPVIQGLGRCLV